MSFAGRTEKPATDIVPVQNLDPVVRELPGTGGEVLFLEPPQGVYEVTITGVLEYTFEFPETVFKRELPSELKQIDAFFIANGAGEFVIPHDWLLVNDSAVKWRSHEKLEWEPRSHTYRFQLNNLGDELRVTLGAQWKRELRTKITTTDHLTVSVRPGASDVQAVAKPPELVERLCLEAELLKGWDDPEFQRRYAAIHRKELLANASQIRKEAQERFKYLWVIEYLKDYYPIAYGRLRGRLDALAIAEQLPKPRLTEHQVRERIVRQHRRRRLDKLALARADVQIEQKEKSRIANEYKHLDEDARQRIEHQMIEPMYEEDDGGKTL